MRKASRAYQKAIELDPQLWSAHSELGINLMRLGQEDEPKRQLELAYNNGYRNAATANSLKLLDSYKNFSTFKDDTLVLKLNTKEADLLLPLFRRCREARDRGVLAEIQDDAAGAGADRALSRSRGLRRAHDGASRASARWASPSAP